jgi:radical SAM/Cys-rich protein
MLDTLPLLKEIKFPAISRKSLDILQVNLGYRCNQQCQHCHVNASPSRTEMMSSSVVNQFLDFVENNAIKTVDLTGGAPEMHPQFEQIINRLSELNVHIIDRCNLTILLENGYRSIPELLAKNKVEVIASLPCYLEENVNSQRGKGVFSSSIEALKLLNDLGYGQPGSGLVLNLVFNPQGASLPPEQAPLENDYKQFLMQNFGVVFNQLFTITNVPIKRFGSILLSKNQFNSYMQLLQTAYQPSNLDSVMCRSQLSVDWQGYLYDCDFNQMLSMTLGKRKQKQNLHINNVTLEEIVNKRIKVAGHCFACTAGQGSSCGGALG